NMMFIAVIGLIVNIIVFMLLIKGGSHGNLNIKSAILHVLGDLLGSIGAIGAGILIFAFGWNIAHPVASVVVAMIILISAIRITKDSLHVLMEGKPNSVDTDDVKHTLLQLTGVVDVHDLHIWSITAEFPTLTCHLVVERNIDRDDLLLIANRTIKEKYQIAHCTIQIEGFNSKPHHDSDFCHCYFNE